MLLKRSLLLMPIIVVSVAFLIPRTSRAFSPIPGDAPPRSCTLPGFLTVTGGPNTLDFPVTVPCPNGLGQCSKWEYRFQWAPGVTPSATLLSVSADIGIRDVSNSCVNTGSTITVIAPGQGVPSFGVGRNDFGQRWLRFSCSAASSQVAIITDLSEPVAGTGAGGSGKNIQFCQLQTPGRQPQGTDTNAAIPIQVIEQLACGTVRRDIDSRGYTTNITPLTGDCPDPSEEVLSNGREQPTLFVDPNTRITFLGSRRYCWPNSFGSLTCIP